MLFCTALHCFSYTLGFLQIPSTVLSSAFLSFQFLFLAFKRGKLVLIQAEFKVVGREALLVIDKSYCAERSTSLPLASHLIHREV